LSFCAVEKKWPALFELLAELRELAPEFRDFVVQLGDFLGQLGDAVAGAPASSVRRFRSLRNGCRCGFNVTRQQMGVPRFLGARLPRQNFYKRRIALHEALKSRIHFGEIVETVHAFRAGAEFAGSLRAAEQKSAEQRRFAAIEVEGFLEAMLVFRDAAIEGVGRAGQTVFFEAANGLTRSFIVELHDRIAIRFLIAGIDQGVQRKRVVVGRGDVLLDQRAKDASFRFVENEIHGKK
jgi:hypothetical protein